MLPVECHVYENKERRKENVKSDWPLTSLCHIGVGDMLIAFVEIVARFFAYVIPWNLTVVMSWMNTAGVRNSSLSKTITKDSSRQDEEEAPRSPSAPLSPPS